MASTDPSQLPPKPTYNTTGAPEESETNALIIRSLGLQSHIEGGYFAEIDRDPLTVPNPFPHDTSQIQTAAEPFSGDDSIRNASTSIYYFLSTKSPTGFFHRNKGRTVHTLIEGRGRYVLIHADEDGEKKRVETFVVGKDVAGGERCVWVVDGGKYKASFLLEGEGLLISETVVPGFEYSDHDFLTREKLGRLVAEEQAEELRWLVRTSAAPVENERRCEHCRLIPPYPRSHPCASASMMSRQR